MTAPKTIWVGTAYGKQAGVDWSEEKVFNTDVRYIRADATELLALIDATKAVHHDNTHGNGLEGFRKNRDRLRICLEQWDAMK